MNNIPRFCDFGISSTFDAVLRYLPIFFAVLRYLSIFSAVLRCSAPPNVPLFKEPTYYSKRVRQEVPGPGVFAVPCECMPGCRVR